MPMDRERETCALNRRGFLGGLTALPLIGGGITLIGAPTAVAEPVTQGLLNSYDTWLFYERCKLKAELLGADAYWDGAAAPKPALEQALAFIPLHNGAVRTHFALPGYGAPSTRAAVVLSAAGVDWREGGR